jgi:predicted nucleotidyltransferase
VDTLEVFGSRVRADYGEGGDPDLLVTFTQVPDLLTFIPLENDLSEGVSHRPVMRRALELRLRDWILCEAIHGCARSATSSKPLRTSSDTVS